MYAYINECSYNTVLNSHSIFVCSRVWAVHCVSFSISCNHKHLVVEQSIGYVGLASN